MKKILVMFAIVAMFCSCTRPEHRTPVRTIVKIDTLIPKSMTIPQVYAYVAADKGRACDSSWDAMVIKFSYKRDSVIYMWDEYEKRYLFIDYK